MQLSLVSYWLVSRMGQSTASRQVAKISGPGGLVPGLTVVLVGEDPASQVYARNKGKAAREAGIESGEVRLPETASEAEILAVV